MAVDEGRPARDEALELELQLLWQTSQPELERRLATIESALANWATTRADPAEMRACQRQAHQLAGSLGMLGFKRATDLARKLNELLQAPAEALDVDFMASLLADLRTEMALGPASAAEINEGLSAPELAGSARVLLAEDDATIATAVRVSLGLDNIDVIWAHNGAEAIEMAGQQDLDLILLDLDLPVLDGLEVCRRLGIDPHLSKLPIVLMTGYSGITTSDPVTSSFVTAYLAKPFRVTDLRNLVRSLLVGG